MDITKTSNLADGDPQRGESGIWNTCLSCVVLLQQIKKEVVAALLQAPTCSKAGRQMPTDNHGEATRRLSTSARLEATRRA